jgi:hypothetical protein
MSRSCAAVIAASLCLSLGLSGAEGVAAAAPQHLKAPAHPRVAPFFGAAPANFATVPSGLVHYHRANVFVGSRELAGYSGWYVVNHRLALGFGARTKYGYPQKIFWQPANTARETVTLRGWNVRTHERIWFGRPLPEANPHSTSPPPVIAWSSGNIRRHHAPSLTFVPSAGCYVIRATWRSGGLTIPFAAGG